MKRIILILINSAAIAGLCACFPDDARDSPPVIRIWNKSDSSISVHIALGMGGYPDTTMLFLKLDRLRKVRAAESTYQTYYNPLETFFKDVLTQDTLSVYFFSQDTLDKYSWEEVQQGYKILKRYDLSIYDIQLLDYVIAYPPTEAMRNMKMWPPYGTK